MNFKSFEPYYFPENTYRHDYGSGYKWLTNTSDGTLEEHIQRCKDEGTTFYKGDYSNLVAFPDAYDIFGHLVPGRIAICRKLY